MNNPLSLSVDPSSITSLVNVALNKRAIQSSLSEWSQAGEAGNAISGSLPHDFASHTAKESRPWWQVDLASEYPLERVVIDNRLGGCRERASSLRVEASVDGAEWILLHAGLCVFGPARTGDPFVLLLGGSVTARFLRLSLVGEQFLHLSQVAIYVRRDAQILFEYCQSSGLEMLFKAKSTLSRPYRITLGDSFPTTNSWVLISPIRRAPKI